MRRDRQNESQSRLRALAATTVDDASMLLAYAMLVSLAEDLALLRVDGYWDLHPAEMRARGGLCIPRRRTSIYEHCRNGDWLLKELESQPLQLLFGVICESSSGRVKMDTSNVVLLSRRISKGMKNKAFAKMARAERRAA